MADPVIIPSFIAFTLGMIVFFLGDRLTKRVGMLREFNIPEPVSGGIAVAVLVWVFFSISGREVVFELETRDMLLVIFFTTIGLNARFADLVRGGRPLAILLVLTVGFMILQNVIGLAGVSVFGLPSESGILLGSAALIGGHGTAIAWAPDLERDFGVSGAMEMGVASATLGLVLAALVGGPIAKFLVERNDLKPENEDAAPVVGMTREAQETASLDYIGMMRVVLTVNISVILGFAAHEAISAMGLKLPLFVPCLIMGIVVANLQPLLLPRLPTVTGTPVLALVSEFTLSVFLSMSLMSMQLWTLISLAGPLFAVLAAQAVLAIAFSIFVLFPLMGGNYRAAVLGAGFGGFALGATPTAIANMTAVTKRYGPAPMAFIILPLVSAFFVDLANAFVIQAFLAL
ncbi:MAG: sodium/glutamate symporter [Pseudomonadota bacterium]